jgi:predicted dehydrogenase
VSRHRQLSLGIVGPGGDWDAMYRPALERLGARSAITALAGSAWRPTNELARGLSARHAGSIRELLRLECDGVLVLDPGCFRLFPLRTAIEHRRSVYLVLPETFDPARLAEHHEQARAAGVLVVPELRLRYTPATLRLRELLATQLGPALTVEIRAVSAGIAPTERVERELIDWCRTVLGSVPHTVAGGDCVESKGPPCRTITLSFDASGQRSDRITVRIVLPVSPAVDQRDTRASDAWPLEFSIRCRQGEARLEDASQLRWREGGREQVESLSTERTAVSVAIDHFARRLAGGLIPVPDLSDVLLAARIASLAERSRAAGGVELACRPL